MRVVALGAVAASDDRAALVAVQRLDAGSAEVVEAGRPGLGLIDLLEVDGPVVLVDVTRSTLAPGTVTRLTLDEVVEAAVSGAQMSSHGFGPAEALRLARGLGRVLPPGRFVGIEGDCFEPGETFSPAVADALDGFVVAIQAAIDECAALPAGSTPCTSRG